MVKNKQDKKLIIVTFAPREHTWEDSYTHNLSGQTDVTEKVAEDPSYRSEELCLVHPAIIRFYEKHKDSFQEAIARGVKGKFPYVIDRTREKGHGIGMFTSFPEGEIPALICETKLERGVFGDETLNAINGKYIIIPLRPEEIAEVDGLSLEAVLRAYKQNEVDLRPEDKSEIRQKLAMLKSLDIYLAEGAIRIRDIPIEISLREGQIDRKALRRYTR